MKEGKTTVLLIRQNVSVIYKITRKALEDHFEITFASGAEKAIKAFKGKPADYFDFIVINDDDFQKSQLGILELVDVFVSAGYLKDKIIVMYGNKGSKRRLVENGFSLCCKENDFVAYIRIITRDGTFVFKENELQEIK